jgi:hypothetical protein
MTTERKLEQKVRSIETADGDGVKIRRIGGQAMQQRMDPFLMLDEFNSDQSADYMGGFPSHPHRGFETITYMKAGKMRHRDHMGNEGVIGPGDVQWMTAARGVIHSETPEQLDGLMQGFQIWLNLPGAEKMKPAAYHDFSADELARATSDRDSEIAVIAGSVDVSFGAEPLQHLTGPLPAMTTKPHLIEIELAAEETVELSFNPEEPAFVYVFEGATTGLKQWEMGLYSAGNLLKLNSTADGATLLVLSGRPIKEPIAQYGPFVMNSRAELEQAVSDYRSGVLTN